MAPVKKDADALNEEITQLKTKLVNVKRQLEKKLSDQKESAKEAKGKFKALVADYRKEAAEKQEKMLATINQLMEEKSVLQQRLGGDEEGGGAASANGGGDNNVGALQAQIDALEEAAEEKEEEWEEKQESWTATKVSLKKRLTAAAAAKDELNDKFMALVNGLHEKLADEEEHRRIVEGAFEQTKEDHKREVALLRANNSQLATVLELERAQAVRRATWSHVTRPIFDLSA
jgi:chromosome segregation ATPase